MPRVAAQPSFTAVMCKSRLWPCRLEECSRTSVCIVSWQVSVAAPDAKGNQTGDGGEVAALCAAPPSCFSELSDELLFHEILKGLDLVKASLHPFVTRPGMQVMGKLSRYHFLVLSHP